MNAGLKQLKNFSHKSLQSGQKSMAADFYRLLYDTKKAKKRDVTEML